MQCNVVQKSDIRENKIEKEEVSFELIACETFILPFEYGYYLIF